MALDVAFHGVPLTVLVPNLLASRTDGQYPPQDFDLLQGLLQLLFPGLAAVHFACELQRRAQPCQQLQAVDRLGEDRKSTRLNSSHLVISYAVFCLKKKKQETNSPLISNT